MKEHEFTENFLKAKGLKPVMRVEEKHGRIYIAESELLMDQPRQYPWGYYQTAWFVMGRIKGSDKNGHLDGGSWGEYDAMHDSDKNLTPEQKQQARINDVLLQAKQYIDKNVELGRYE